MKRKLGQHGPELFPIGLGCMGMSEFYGPADDAQSIAVIHHALEHGANFLDTADMYGVGRNEVLVGKAIADRRDQVVLATKFGVLRGEDGSFRGVSGKPEHVQQACEASLKRLGIETIDLYYQHRVDPGVPIEDTVGAMAKLVQQGKVKHLGLSEASADTLRRAQKVHPITALQSELSLWSRDLESTTVKACAELGIAFVAYSPLGRGFLTGQIKQPNQLSESDFRRHSERFVGDNLEQNRKLLELLEGFAAKKGCTTAQLALAWVLSRGDHVFTIPGTRKTHRLDENIAAAEVELSSAELTQLDELAPAGAFAGQRYPESAMALLNG